MRCRGENNVLPMETSAARAENKELVSTIAVQAIAGLALPQLIDRIELLEQKLFNQNFSYARSVRDKLEPKQGEKEARTSNRENGNEDEADEGQEKDKEPEASDKNDEEGDEDEDANADPDYLKKIEPAKPAAPAAETGDPKVDDNISDKSDMQSNGGADSFDKIMEDHGSSSNSGDQSHPEMVYRTQDEITLDADNKNNFIHLIPEPAQKCKLFFGGNNFYICLRFYYTLFERMLKAYELAREKSASETLQTLSDDEIERLGQERYDTFKDILKLYIKEGFEPAMYEDCLRCIYGRDAGFLFSIDKIVSNIIKNLPIDEVSEFVLSNDSVLFSSPTVADSDSQLVKYAEVSQCLRDMLEKKTVKNTQTANATNQQNSNLLRYYYDSNQKVVHINQIPSQFNKWNSKGLKVAKKHFDQLMTDDKLSGPAQAKTLVRPASEAAVFLSKNKRKSSLKSLNPKDIKIANRITYKTIANHLTLIPAIPQKEDILIRLSNRRDEVAYTRSNLLRVLKFRVNSSLTRTC